MSYMIEVLRQEHCNIESLLRVLERELSVFERGDRPDYEVILGVINYFKDYPDSCHHPKEDLIIEKLKARDPRKAAAIGDLEAEHREGAKRLRRVALAVERVLSDQDLLRQTVDDIAPCRRHALRGVSIASSRVRKRAELRRAVGTMEIARSLDEVPSS